MTSESQEHAEKRHASERAEKLRMQELIDEVAPILHRRMGKKIDKDGRLVDKTAWDKTLDVLATTAKLAVPAAVGTAAVLTVHGMTTGRTWNPIRAWVPPATKK